MPRSLEINTFTFTTNMSTSKERIMKNHDPENSETVEKFIRKDQILVYQEAKNDRAQSDLQDLHR